MNAGTPSDRELDGYRTGADRFIAELDEEYYLHYAGLKEKLELAPIYERYSELTKLEQAQALGQAADDDRGIRELWRFAAALSSTSSSTSSTRDAGRPAAAA